MNKKHLCSIAIGAFSYLTLSAASWGATYYVDNASLGGACADSNSGTALSTPWCTISKANGAVKAGDTVMIRKGSYSQQIAPAQNGTASLGITYKNYGSEQVILTAKQSISLANRSYITVDGVTIRLSGCSGVCYALFDGSNYNTIQNSVMDQAGTLSGWPVGVVIRNKSLYNRLLNNTIANVGYSSGNPGDDIGGVIDIGNIDDTTFDGSNNNLIQGNKIFHGGHHVLSVGSSYNVIKGNYIHNEEWNACSRTQANGKCGDRLIIIDEDATLVKQNLIEDNILGFSGLPADQNGSDGISMRTPYNIIRRNVFVDNDSSGISVATAGYYPSDVRFNHIYNNVFFHNGYALIEDYKPYLSGVSLSKWGSTDVKNVTIKNNIFWNNNFKQSITYYASSSANQIIANNLQETADPLFVNDKATLDPLHPETLNFHLNSGSPAINAGGFLTSVTAGGSGTVIPVADAAYFTNGFGLMSGDQIQLQGQTTRVRIVSVDYTKNTLTLDASLTWQQGQGLSLAFEGSAPDQGVYEFAAGQTATIEPPNNLRIVQ
jgi:hypothetical protein